MLYQSPSQSFLSHVEYYHEEETLFVPHYVLLLLLLHFSCCDCMLWTAHGWPEELQATGAAWCVGSRKHYLWLQWQRPLYRCFRWQNSSMARTRGWLDWVCFYCTKQASLWRHFKLFPQLITLTFYVNFKGKPHASSGSELISWPKMVTCKLKDSWDIKGCSLLFWIFETISIVGQLQ